MKKLALYQAHSLFEYFGFPKPPPIEVEFLQWEPGGMARVLVPYAENSIGAIIARNAGRGLPPPELRLVPATAITIIEAQA